MMFCHRQFWSAWPARVWWRARGGWEAGFELIKAQARELSLRWTYQRSRKRIAFPAFPHPLWTVRRASLLGPIAIFSTSSCSVSSEPKKDRTHSRHRASCPIVLGPSHSYRGRKERVPAARASTSPVNRSVFDSRCLHSGDIWIFELRGASLHTY